MFKSFFLLNNAYYYYLQNIVPWVQAYAYTKYLGHLKMTFDDAGNLETWRGLPWLMDDAVEQAGVNIWQQRGRKIAILITRNF